MRSSRTDSDEDADWVPGTDDLCRWHVEESVVDLILTRRIVGPRFTRIESLSNKTRVHRFKIQSLGEIDDEII